MTDARRRLVFTDTSTGLTARFKDGVGYPEEMAVVYLGRRVGTLYSVQDYGNIRITYQFREIYPGTHQKTHWINHLRAHLLRYFDAKFARLAVSED